MIKTASVTKEAKPGKAVRKQLFFVGDIVETAMREHRIIVDITIRQIALTRVYAVRSYEVDSEVATYQPDQIHMRLVERATIASQQEAQAIWAKELERHMDDTQPKKKIELRQPVKRRQLDTTRFGYLLVDKNGWTVGHA